VRDRLADHRHGKHRLAGGFLGLPDRIRNSASLAQADADLALVVTHDHEDRPRGGLTALVGLEHFVGAHDANVELRPLGVAALTLAAQAVHHSH
jgi:hypothetical protein